VVTVANLQDKGTAKMTAWDNVAAAKRLGMAPEECRDFLKRYAEQVAAAQSLLGIAKPAAPTGAEGAPPRMSVGQDAAPAKLTAAPSQPEKRGFFSLLKSLLGK
jgi:hypothetical protein